MTKTIADKLHVKNAASFAVLNADARHAHLLDQLPAARRADAGPADLVLLFVDTFAQFAAQLPTAQAALAPGGALWVAYVKGTSKLRQDAGLQRDTLRAHAETAGLTSVAMIALDDDWSALRFKAG